MSLKRVMKNPWFAAWKNSSRRKTGQFEYDGWNLIAELDQEGHPVGTYVWGPDLSGTLQGAGGVGGLVMAKHWHVGDNATTFPAYDGNGNIRGLFRSDNGTIETYLSYDPFGQTFSYNRNPAAPNPFGLNTKPYDNETGTYQFPTRPYGPPTGSWFSRDSIGEMGGENLYGYVKNDPINRIDPLGQWGSDVHYGKTYEWAIDTKYKKECANEIAASDLSVDATFGGRGPLPYIGDMQYHFDTDAMGINYIPGTRNRIAEKHFKNADNILNSGKDYLTVLKALTQVGIGLHPTQDAFSHNESHMAHLPIYHAPKRYCWVWGDADGNKLEFCIWNRLNNPNWENENRPDDATLWMADVKRTEQATKGILNRFMANPVIQCQCKVRK